MSTMTTLTLPTLSPRSIPFDSGWPLIGHLVGSSLDILGFLIRMAHKHPELVEIKVLGSTFYMINHPDLLEQVLVKNSHAFIKDKMLKHMGQPVFGTGLLSSDGDFWLRQRRMAQPAFHRQRIMTYAEDTVHFTERAMAVWQPGEVRDLHQDMMTLTLEIVTKTLFNAEDNQDVRDISHALDAIMERFSSDTFTDLLEAAFGKLYTSLV